MLIDILIIKKDADDEITVTFICKGYPRILVKHLNSFRDINIEQVDKGIYYLT